MTVYQAEYSPESRSAVVDGDGLEEKRDSKSEENSDSIRRNIGVTNLEIKHDNFSDIEAFKIHLDYCLLGTAS